MLASPAQKRAHLGMTKRVIVSLDKDQPVFAGCGGPVELMLRGRKSLGVFMAVAVADQAEIDIAAVHLGQVDFIRPPPRCGKILEQEHLTESAEQGVVFEESFDGAALRSELLLYRTDEYPDPIHDFSIP